MVFGEKIGNIPSWILGKKVAYKNKKCNFHILGDMVIWLIDFG